MSRHCAILLAVAGLSGVTARCPSVLAEPQFQSQPGRGRSVAFAHYVPMSAQVFLNVREVREFDRAIQRARARQLVSVLTQADSEPSGSRLGVEDAVHQLIASQSSMEGDELSKAEVALVAGSWRQLAYGVWFIRLPRIDALDRWFPVDERLGNRRLGQAELFQTRQGIIVCVRGDVMMAARRLGNLSLVREVITLMSGRPMPALADFPTYMELSSSSLPSHPLAVIYVQELRGLSSQRSAFTPWSKIKYAVVKMYEKEERLDFALQGTLASPRRSAELPKSVVTRFWRLPETTLFALGTRLDIEQMFQTTTGEPGAGPLGRYLALMAGLRDPESVHGAHALPPIGPEVLFVWDDDFRERGGGPQVALLLKCSDPDALSQELEQIVLNTIKVIEAVDSPPVSQTLTLEKGTRLGVRITSLPLASHIQNSKLGFAQLFSNIEPAWASWDEWFVLALSRQHIERILDADQGLMPSLGSLEGIRSTDETVNEAEGSRSTLAVLRAEPAANIMAQWLRSYYAGEASLLDPSWWEPQGQASPSRRRYWGMGVRLKQEPGVAMVQKVFLDTPAFERVMPGDLVLAVDGSVLDYRAPNLDLRRRLARSTSRPGPVVRVLRGQELLDIELPLNRSLFTSAELLEPADAVEELVTMGRSVELVSLSILPGDGDHISMRWSLRFIPEPPQ